jgi:uncharacterized phage protein gp47/JayE
MIDFSDYTNQKLQRQMLNRVPNNLDKREGSLIQTAIAPVAWMLEGFALEANQIQENSNPYDAVGEALDYLVSTKGLTRKQATPAVAVGQFNAAIPSGSQFRTINGTDSVTFTSGEQISASVGDYRYYLTCDTAGEIGNHYTGNILPITAIPNLTTAVILSISTIGTDEETDDSLRQRFFNSFDAAPYGGNMSQYRQSILAIDGVGAVQIYPANSYNGGGTTLCSILGDDLRPADSALVQTVQDTICPYESGTTTPSPNGYGIAPIGASVTITTGTEYALNIVAGVSFTTGISNGAETYKEAIKEAIEEYIATVRESWGAAQVARTIAYNVSVYVARIISAIISVPAVVNVASLTINGQSADLNLTEDSSVQYVPVLGTLTINEV